MPNMGIKPATLQSLAQHFNQLSYAAASLVLMHAFAKKLGAIKRLH